MDLRGLPVPLVGGCGRDLLYLQCGEWCFGTAMFSKRYGVPVVRSVRIRFRKVAY